MLNSEIDRMPFRMPNTLDAIGLSIWHPDCCRPNHKPMVFRMLQLMLEYIKEASCGQLSMNNVRAISPFRDGSVWRLPC